MRIPGKWRFQTNAIKFVGGVYEDGEVEFPLRRTFSPGELVVGPRTAIVYKAGENIIPAEEIEIQELALQAVKEGDIEIFMEEIGHNGHDRNGTNGYNRHNGSSIEGSLIKPPTGIEDCYGRPAKERE